MPKGYEEIRDQLIRDGMDPDAAKGKAARIWNSQHSNNPVGRSHGKRKRRSK